jgi:hypothetical protein
MTVLFLSSSLWLCGPCNQLGWLSFNGQLSKNTSKTY